MPQEKAPEKPAAAEDVFDLDAISLHDSTPAKKPDSLSEMEESTFNKEQRKAELESFQQDTSERKTYSHKIFGLVCKWLIGMFALLVAEGALSPWGVFHLPDGVMLAAIGGTTLNVLGLFVIVANYLFPKRK